MSVLDELKSWDEKIKTHSGMHEADYLGVLENCVEYLGNLNEWMDMAMNGVITKTGEIEKQEIPSAEKKRLLSISDEKRFQDIVKSKTSLVKSQISGIQTILSSHKRQFGGAN